MSLNVVNVRNLTLEDFLYFKRFKRSSWIYGRELNYNETWFITNDKKLVRTDKHGFLWVIGNSDRPVDQIRILGKDCYVTVFSRTAKKTDNMRDRGWAEIPEYLLKMNIVTANKKVD